MHQIWYIAVKRCKKIKSFEEEILKIFFNCWQFLMVEDTGLETVQLSFLDLQRVLVKILEKLEKDFLKTASFGLIT